MVKDDQPRRRGSDARAKDIDHTAERGGQADDDEAAGTAEEREAVAADDDDAFDNDEGSDH